MSGDKTPRNGRSATPSAGHRRSGTRLPYGRRAQAAPELASEKIDVVAEWLSEQGPFANQEPDVDAPSPAKDFIRSLELPKREAAIKAEALRLKASARELAAETSRVSEEEKYYREQIGRQNVAPAMKTVLQERREVTRAERAATPKRVRHDQGAFDRLQSNTLELSTLQEAAPKIAELYQATDPAVSDVPFQVIEAEMKRLGTVVDGMSTRDKALAVLRMQIEAKEAFRHFPDRTPEGLAFLREQLASQFAAVLKREADKPKRDQYQFSGTLAPGQEMYFLSLDTLVRPVHMLSGTAVKAAQKATLEASEDAFRMEIEAARARFEGRLLGYKGDLESSAAAERARNDALRIRDAEAARALMEDVQVAALQVEEAKARTILEAERAVLEAPALERKRNLDGSAAAEHAINSALRARDAGAVPTLMEDVEVAALQLEEAKRALLEAGSARIRIEIEKLRIEDQFKRGMPAWNAENIVEMQALEDAKHEEYEAAGFAVWGAQVDGMKPQELKERAVVAAIEARKDEMHIKMVKPVAEDLVGSKDGNWLTKALLRPQRTATSGTESAPDAGRATAIIRAAVINRFKEQGVEAFNAFMNNPVAIEAQNATLAAALKEYYLKRDGAGKVAGARSFNTVDTLKINDDGSVTVTEMQKPGEVFTTITAQLDGSITHSSAVSTIDAAQAQTNAARVEARRAAQAAAREQGGRH